MATATATVELAGIDPNRTYRLEDFMRISGLGVHAMRTARRKGLKVRRSGNRGFVRGADFVSYLEAQDEAGAES